MLKKERHVSALLQVNLYNKVLSATHYPESNVSGTTLLSNIPIILEYIHQPIIEVISIGDKNLKNLKITVKQDVLAKINRMNPDSCFIETNVIDTASAIIDNDLFCHWRKSKYYSPNQVCDID